MTKKSSTMLHHELNTVSQTCKNSTNPCPPPDHIPVPRSPTPPKTPSFFPGGMLGPRGGLGWLFGGEGYRYITSWHGRLECPSSLECPFLVQDEARGGWGKKGWGRGLLLYP